MNELDLLVGIIKEFPSVRSVILFGSTARGTRRDDSDIDILVLVEDGSMNRLDLSAEIRRRAYGKLVTALDLLVEGIGEFEERKLLPTLERRIAREGRVLYAA